MKIGHSIGFALRKLQKRRPSPAMAVALLALVVAMSGTAIAATQLGKNTVGTRQLKRNAVRVGKLAPEAVRAGKLAKGAIATNRLRDGVVATGKIADQAVTSGKLADNAFSTGKIANDAVTSEKIGTEAVITGKIAKEAVLADKIANGAVTGESVADGALGTEDFSSAIPAASATATADQSIANGTNTNVVLDAETFDTRNMHSNGAGNTKIFAPVDGVYLISGTVEWGFTSNARGPRVLSIHKNGSGGTLAYDARSMDTHEALVEVLSQTVSTAAVLKAGDYIELEVLQDTTQFPAETHPAVTLENDVKNTPELTMVWLAPGPA